MSDPMRAPAETTFRAATSDDLEDVARLYIELKHHHSGLAPGATRYQVPDDKWARLAARWLAGSVTV
jgi:hypothetical protein